MTNNFCGPGEGVTVPAKTVTVYIDVYEGGLARTSLPLQFKNVPLSIVEEAIAHINDNGQVNP